MNTSQSILITGASSSLMQELIKKIDREKFQILGVSRDKSKIQNLGIELLEGNICDTVFVNKIISEKKINIILHAASITHSYNVNDYFNVNLQSTINLVNASKHHNVNKFIFISSRTVGKKSGAYGLSKLYSEEYIKNNFDNWLIIRPSEIYGGNKNEGMDKLIYDIIYKKIILCPLNMKSKFYPIHNMDAAQIIYDLIFQSPVGTNNKLITINGHEGFSYYELIRTISKITNKKKYIIPIPKLIMFFIKWLMEIFRIKVGIFPDQISRLYSSKETGLRYKTVSIEEHVISENLLVKNKDINHHKKKSQSIYE